MHWWDLNKHTKMMYKLLSSFSFDLLWQIDRKTRLLNQKQNSREHRKLRISRSNTGFDKKLEQKKVKWVLKHIGDFVLLNRTLSFLFSNKTECNTNETKLYYLSHKYFYTVSLWQRTWICQFLMSEKTMIMFKLVLLIMPINAFIRHF